MSGPRPGETQPERTVLSWQRTGLGILAVGGLLAHRSVLAGRPELLVVAGGIALLGLGVLGALAPLRDRALRRADPGRGPAAAPGLVAVATGMVVLVALAALGALLSAR